MFAVYHNNPILLFRSNSQKVYCKKAILKSLPRGFATITILNNNFFWSTCEQLLWSFIKFEVTLPFLSNLKPQSPIVPFIFT